MRMPRGLGRALPKDCCTHAAAEKPMVFPCLLPLWTGAGRPHPSGRYAMAVNKKGVTFGGKESLQIVCDSSPGSNSGNRWQKCGCHFHKRMASCDDHDENDDGFSAEIPSSRSSFASYCLSCHRMISLLCGVRLVRKRMPLGSRNS